MLARPALAPLALAAALSACAGDGSDTSLDSDTASDGGTGESTSSGGDTVASTTGGSTDTDTTTGEPGLPPLPPLGHVPWTTESRIVAAHAAEAAPYLDPRDPALRQQALDEGYGDIADAAPEPIQDRTLDDAPPPAPGASPALLGRFVHLADTQLADDESPTRVVLLDNTEALSSAFRPQESHACRTLDAAARTINAVHAEHPLDLVILGGDNIDSAQGNELAWFTGILNGDPVVHCDSGVDDDPVPGPANDPKDPFGPVGLEVPWRWVSGNHDVLVQGNFTAAAQKSAAISDQAPGGTRDWSKPEGPVISGTIPADPARALVGDVLLGIVGADGDGHGVDAASIERGRAFYSFPLADAPILFLVVDTAADTGGGKGIIRQGEVDELIRPALDAAEAAQQMVLVTPHHGATSLGDGGDLGGTVQPDAITPDEFQALLGEYPGVLMHLCAHSHTHRVRVIEPLGGAAYWEVATASLSDYPQQLRVVEIHDQDDGWLTITGVALDYAVDGDPLAAEGRRLAYLDYTSAWRGSGTGTEVDRNVRLWVQSPW